MMRRRLTSWENDASSPHGKTRRRLILARGDKATPHPCAGRRGDASSLRGETRRRLVAWFPYRETHGTAR
ncbi:hypothetical protein BHE74_00043286 [Ensete ventricosum]|nr:hypothetical protein BHE74_00043286 [Ensete ventricosum]